MAKLGVWSEEPLWHNPLQDYLGQEPFLGELVFANDHTTADGIRALAMLQLFYCSDGRDKILGAVDELDRFVGTHSGHHLMLISGDVGVGKTWFVRYKMHCSKEEFMSRACVVDLLRKQAPSVRSHIMSQLEQSLNLYFLAIDTSSQEQLYILSERRYRATISKKDDVPLTKNETDDVHQAVKAIEGNRSADIRVDFKLAALEQCDGPMLIVVLDNVDRLPFHEQQEILDEAPGLLRGTKIKLIIPLRTTSEHLRSRFANLRQFVPHTMELPPLDIRKVISLRFMYDAYGQPLSDKAIVNDDGMPWTWKDIADRLLDGDVGDILASIGSSNCRIALEAVRRVMRSNALGSLEALGDPARVLSTLMLHDDKTPDSASLVCNVIMPLERRKSTSTGLLKLRLLELIRMSKTLDFASQNSRDELSSLGYSSQEDIIKSLSELRGSQIIESESKFDNSGMLGTTSLEDIGKVHCTSLGELYISKFLQYDWYFFACKRTLVDVLPEQFISYDSKTRYPYMTHTNLEAYLRECCEEERVARQRWEQETAHPVMKMNKYIDIVARASKLMRG